MRTLVFGFKGRFVTSCECCAYKNKAKDMDALLAELEALKAAKAAAEGASAPETDSSVESAPESTEASEPPSDSGGTEE